MHIGLLGNFGATNIGDDALLAAQIHILRTHPDFQDAFLVVFSANPHLTKKQWKEDTRLKVLPLFPAGFRSLLKHGASYLLHIPTILRCKAILFGGGGLFTDVPHPYAITLWKLQWTALHKILRRPFLITGQSLSSFISPHSEKKVKPILQKSMATYLRDQASCDQVKTFTTITPTRLPDLAWFLPLGARKEKVEKDTIHIALSLRPWKDTADAIPRIIEAFNTIGKKERRHIHLHLIPMQTIKEGDFEVLTSFKEKLPNHIASTIHTPSSFKEVEEILSTMNYAIGMRLHFLILATRSGCPAFGLSYGSKVSELCKELHIPHSKIGDLRLLAQTLPGHYKERKRNVQAKAETMHTRSNEYQTWLKKYLPGKGK